MQGESPARIFALVGGTTLVPAGIIGFLYEPEFNKRRGRARLRARHPRRKSASARGTRRRSRCSSRGRSELSAMPEQTEPLGELVPLTKELMALVEPMPRTVERISGPAERSWICYPRSCASRKRSWAGSKRRRKR